MTMIPTATGYDLIVKLRPAHRALMSADGARLNLAAKAGLTVRSKRGAHWAPLTGAAAWAAEEAAQVREIIRGGAR